MMRLLISLLFTCGLAAASDWSATERAFVQSLGPWPQAAVADASNRLSGDVRAIELGRQLFFDRRLSANNALACADCHRPDAQFADGIALNRGFGALARHTPALLNLSQRYWFGWGGENDNLWAQSMRPILTPEEMNASLTQVSETLRQDDAFACRFQATTGLALQTLDEQTQLVWIGKLLAAYQETIVTGRTAFDTFRDQLLQGQPLTALNASEQAGLKLFIGEGRCVFCHSGAGFSNGEFGDIGVSFFTASGVDKGRYAGIQSVTRSPFNRLGAFSDSIASGSRTQHIQLLHRNWGEFRVPSLRNVADTAPYMHNGSVETLAEVVDFYSELDEERLHTDGEKILRPLHLSAPEKQNLIAFLQSLSAPVSAATDQPDLFQNCPQAAG
ncbi:cytochrome-c peroxidase [Reinekea marinisedimentorum]|uniref:Cytochrome c peroxidase n=1 Tax=Reinekea marinisedimentorum TaxID=230495 RepID=A0A4R3HZI9_9GAMM|nr:cytochrome c peroxidase [Reinekea marinisedimentorum]TCS37685.1 cytochrome c peroxidase [Reinekea marinisedimentorum]